MKTCSHVPIVIAGKGSRPSCAAPTMGRSTLNRRALSTIVSTAFAMTLGSCHHGSSGAATVAPTWTAPIVIGTGDVLSLVADGLDEVHALYGGQGQPAIYAKQDARGVWSAGETLPVARVASARLAIDSSGRVLAALVASNGDLVVTSRTAAGTWSRPQIVQTGGVTEPPEIDVADTGQVLVAWQQGLNAFARCFTTDSWGEVRSLGQTIPRVWLDHRGGGYVVFALLRSTGTYPTVYSVQQVRECVDVDGAWTRCDPGQGTGGVSPVPWLDAAISSDGSVLLVIEWSWFDFIEYRRELMTLRSAGGWMTGGVGATRLEHGWAYPEFRSRVSGVFGAERILVWEGGYHPFYPTGGLTATVGNIQNGAWSMVTQVARPTARIDTFAATVSPAGRGLVAWDDGGIQVREHVAPDGWKDPQLLSQHLKKVSGLQIVSRSDGRTTVIWSVDNDVMAAHER